MTTRNRSLILVIASVAIVASAGTAAMSGNSFSAPASFPNGIQTTAVTFGNTKPDGTFDPVVDIGLSVNNEKPYPGRLGRLSFKWRGTYSSEIMTEPGPNAHPCGNIVGQIMQMGPLPPTGKGRARVTTSLVTDRSCSLSAVIDASTTDASGSTGQKDAPPLVFSAGEGKGMYIILYPADNTVDFQDRVSATSTGRMPLARVIKQMRQVSK